MPNVAPAITHIPVTSLNVGNPIDITATVIDNTNSLSAVKLYYRKVGQLLYQEEVMLNISGNNYRATIPSSYVTNAGVEYYIYAVDDFGVGNSSGSSNHPLEILGAIDFVPYLSEKANLITDILNVEPPTKYLGWVFRTKPYFNDIELAERDFVNAVDHANNLNNADPLDMEAVARLALCERITKRALIDGKDIADYGAQGLKSISVSSVFKFGIKHLGNITHIKALTSAGDKIDNAIYKLHLSFITGAFPPGQITLPEQQLAQTITEQGLLNAYTQISKKTEDGIDNFLFDARIFDAVDNIVQEYAFLYPFELLSTSKQDKAFLDAKTHNFSNVQFSDVLNNNLNLYNDLIAFTSSTKDYGNFVNTIREISGWVAFGAAVILVIAGIIAAIPSGGSSLLASIAGIAYILIKLGSLVSTSSAIVEAGVAAYAVDYRLPFTFLNESVQMSFSSENIYARSLLPITENSKKEEISKLTKHFQESLNSSQFFERLRQKVESHDDSWANLVIDSLNVNYDNLDNEDRLSMADFFAVKNYMKDSVPNFKYWAQEFVSRSASRDIYSAGLEINAYTFNAGIKNSSSWEYALTTLDSIQINQSILDNIKTQLYYSIQENNIIIPTTIGIGKIDFDIISAKPAKIILRAEVTNYGSEKVTGLKLLPILISQGNVVGDTSRVYSLNPYSTSTIEYTIEGIESTLVGNVALKSSQQNPDYIILPGKPFYIDLAFNSPDVTGNLSNETVYAFPNPFNPSHDDEVTLRFKIKTSSDVKIKIYNVANTLVKNIYIKNLRGTSQLSVNWDGRDDNGNIVANGVYFYVIESSTGERAVGKIAVLK